MPTPRTPSGRWDNVNGYENVERYYQGYYGIKAALNFLPFNVTIAKFFQNIKGSFQGLMSENLKSKPFYSKLTPQQKSLLEADCIKDSNFAKFLDEGGEGAKMAWKGLLDRPEWVRNNTGLLNKLVGNRTYRLTKSNPYQRRWKKSTAFV